MESEQRALLRTVIDHYADDAPRWIYADWLDEHDEHDVAELIRVSLTLPDLRQRVRTSDEYMAIAEGETTLRYELAKRFVGNSTFLFYERGLFHRAVVYRNMLREFLTYFQTLIRMYPVTQLELHGANAQEIRLLCACDELQYVRDFSLTMECDDLRAIVALLLGCPFWRDLQRIMLREVYQSSSISRGRSAPMVQVLNEEMKHQLQQRFGSRLVLQ